MVNTGRPSGGCDVCKRRKIKCDERRPYCRRCEKAGRDCPGVPEQQVLAFRNSSSLRTESPGPSHQLSRHQSQSSRQSSRDDTPIHEEEEPLPVPGPDPDYPLECQAVALFLHDYSVMPSDPRLWIKPMLFVRELYINAPRSEAVHAATAAPALAALATLRGQPELKVFALRKYGKAINLIQHALTQDETAISDGTLGGILVLKMFESLSQTTHDRAIYQSHNSGMKAILRRRGARNFESDAKLRLFRAFRTHLVMSSLEYAEPSEPLDLSDTTFVWFGDRDLPDPTQHNTALMKLGYDLSWVRFRTDMTLSSSSRTPDPDAAILNTLVSQLRDLDIRLDAWFDQLPAEWWPSILSVSGYDNEVWHSTIHIFPDRLLADIFDFAYVMRIIIHSLILSLSYHLGDDPPLQSTYAIQTAADGICASIPWLFGSEALGESNPALGKGYIDPLAWFRGGLMVCMKWMPWPARCEGIVPSEQRRWLKGRLEMAGRETGSAQALALAGGIEA